MPSSGRVVGNLSQTFTARFCVSWALGFILVPDDVLERQETWSSDAIRIDFITIKQRAPQFEGVFVRPNSPQLDVRLIVEQPDQASDHRWIAPKTEMDCGHSKRQFLDATVVPDVTPLLLVSPLTGLGVEVGLHQNQGLLTNNAIIEMFRVLKRTNEGFRAVLGTALKNEATGALVYVPAQSGEEIVAHMTALERFINDDAASDLDPLVKMALIHHQFESIHPFSDGNGRIGRIINVLYLTRVGLLEIPILYLSRYVTARKADYYRLLQAVRDDGAWEPWLLYMLRAVSETSRQTLELIEGMRSLMADYKRRLREHPSVRYSQDLLNNLFRHPYTRIEFLQADLGISRQTAAKYLDQLAEAGFVEKHQQGRNNYYINTPLIELFMRVSDSP